MWELEKKKFERKTMTGSAGKRGKRRKGKKTIK